MTDDVKATRLSKAAREFNVGISTIVEFLHKKGFDLDPNPNTKLPHEAYILLVKEYSTDISAKKESEKLVFKDLHRKKESVSIDDFSEKAEAEETEGDQDVLVKDSTVSKPTVDLKTEIKKPDIKLVGKIDLEKTLKPKAEKPAVQKEESPAKPVAKPAETEKQVKEAPAARKEKKVEEAPVEEKRPKANFDLHIVGKIDLDTINKETKPAKKDEKKEKGKHAVKEPGEEKQVETAKPVSKKEPEPIEDEIEAEIIEELLTAELPEEKILQGQEEDVVALYKTDRKKLTGPVVVGKIDLPVEEKKKSTPYQPVKVNGDSDFRRKKKRKRLYLLLTRILLIRKKNRGQRNL